MEHMGCLHEEPPQAAVGFLETNAEQRTIPSRHAHIWGGDAFLWGSRDTKRKTTIWHSDQKQKTETCMSPRENLVGRLVSPPDMLTEPYAPFVK